MDRDVKSGLALKRKTEEILVFRLEGKVIGRIKVIEAGREYARILLDFPSEFEVNRNEVDETKYPDDYRKPEGGKA